MDIQHPAEGTPLSYWRRGEGLPVTSGFLLLLFVSVVLMVLQVIPPRIEGFLGPTLVFARYLVFRYLRR